MRQRNERREDFLELERRVREELPDEDAATIAHSVANLLDLPTEHGHDGLRVYVTGHPGSGTYLSRR